MAKKISRFRSYEGASEELLKRTKESYKNRDVTGKYQPFLRVKDIPIPQWKCKEGDHIIDILPWISNDNYPVPEKRNRPVYNLDVWVHRKVGPNENDYLCLARNFGKACPICDDLTEIKKTRNYDEKYVKDMSPKRRVAYVIQVYDSAKEEEAGPYWWEAAHFSTEMNIIAIANSRRTGGMLQFMDPDSGKSIEFSREGSGMANTRYIGYRFADRDYKIGDDILDMVPNLEDYIDIPEYEELQEVYLNGIGNDPVGDQDEADQNDSGNENKQDEDTPPPSERRSRRTDSSESKMEQEQAHENSLEEETPPPTSSRRTLRSSANSESATTGTRRVLRRSATSDDSEKEAETPPPRTTRTLRTGTRSSVRSQKTEDD